MIKGILCKSYYEKLSGKNDYFIIFNMIFFKVYILVEIDYLSLNEDMVILGNNRDYDVFGRFYCFC